MTASMFASGGGRKPPQAQLPGEDDDSFVADPDTRPLLSGSSPGHLVGWLRKHGPLLGGSAMAVTVAAGAILFWLSPYNQVIPVASGVRSMAAAVGLSAPPILAPTAALARVVVEPPLMPSREKTTIPPKSEQLQEMLALAGDSPSAPSPAGAVTALGGSAAKPAAAAVPQPAIELPAPQAAALPRSTEPSVGEVGVAPRVPAGQPGSAGTPAHAGGRSSTSESSDAIAEPTEVQQAATRQLAALDKAVPAAPVFIGPTPNPHPESAFARMSGAAADDPAADAARLTAGPMTTADDIEVIQLVNQLAKLVADEREQISHLRDDEARRAERDADRLSELDRRLSLAEAKGSIAVALGTPATVPDPPAPTPARSSTAPAAGPGHKTAPAANPQPAPARQYRVQAASPTLALLAVVDRSGDESDQLQVSLGDIVPGGYGKVTRIAQNGTAWVVETEHGKIQ